MNTGNIYEIPATLERRMELRRLICDFARDRSLTPPLTLEMLGALAFEFMEAGGCDPALKGWIMVELFNAVWRDTVSCVPHSRRILLLPQCLRRSESCTAEIDEIGLLCRRCGGCSINRLEDMAAELGTMSIVAEGFTAAKNLIENGVVDAVIGVGCLESLEKAFPLLVKGAVPGLAVPLNRAGCKDTDVDVDWVAGMIAMQSDTPAGMVDYDYLDFALGEWFSEESLGGMILPGADSTSTAAMEWMISDGKRLRPYLLAATYLALTGKDRLPESVKRAAVAVECFHKASLVHDDIQDGDEYRYGMQTVWARHGVPVAVNVGDILLGEGYRLLALCGRADLTGAVAGAHVALCRGQGMELEWSRAPRPYSMDFVFDIFRGKTVPAFDVSLAMGVMCAGGDRDLLPILRAYSEELGTAYQLRDDADDFGGDAPQTQTPQTQTKRATRPSAVVAAVLEQCPDRQTAAKLLTAADMVALLRTPEYSPLLDNALERVAAMVADRRARAFEIIQRIDNVELRKLLFRVTGRILG